MALLVTGLLMCLYMAYLGQVCEQAFGWSCSYVYNVEIDHEIISTVILLPSADSFKNGCCQLQAKVCAQITG